MIVTRSFTRTATCPTSVFWTTTLESMYFPGKNTKTTCPTIWTTSTCPTQSTCPTDGQLQPNGSLQLNSCCPTLRVLRAPNIDREGTP